MIFESILTSTVADLRREQNDSDKHKGESDEYFVDLHIESTDFVLVLALIQGLLRFNACVNDNSVDVFAAHHE